MEMGKGEECNGTEIVETKTFLKTSSPEASKMLAAALLQMDGIISGGCTDGSDTTVDWENAVKEASKNLVAAIQSAPLTPPPPDAEIIDVLLQWMMPVTPSTRILSPRTTYPAF